MPTFNTIKNNIRIDLNNTNPSSYSASDLDDSVQDAYDDIVCLSQCLIKKITLSWVAELVYYDFSSLVSDYMACIAVYDNTSKRWLDDDKNTKIFDQIDIRWEVANGTPQNWAPVNHKYIAFFPRYTAPTGTFDLYYWATAPTVNNSDTPLIATDCQVLVNKYVVADLLEQFEEFTKAQPFWAAYMKVLEDYTERVKNLAMNDVLFRL